MIMKRLSILKSTLVAAVLCAAAFAQQTITTTTATDNGGNVSITTTAVLTTTGQRAVLGISVYQGSSTLLKSQTFCYNNYAGNCLSQTVTFPITQETVTTIMGSVSSKSVLT